MMQASLSEVRMVALPNLKHRWKISNANDVVTVGAKAFVRVTTLSSSLVGLVTEANPDVPSPLPKCWSLTSSKGLCDLIRLRNEAQADSMASSGCKLFEAPIKKRRLRSRPSQEVMRTNPDSLMLEVVLDGVYHNVSVLRPVHPTDNLFVEYEESTLTVVLNYLRSQGFDLPPRRKSTDLPVGTSKHNKGFICKYKKQDGTSGYKCVKTLNEGKAFQADPLGYVAEMSDGDNLEEPRADQVSQSCADDDHNGTN